MIDTFLTNFMITGQGRYSRTGDYLFFFFWKAKLTSKGSLP